MATSVRHICRSLICLSRITTVRRAPIRSGYLVAPRPFSSAFIQRADQTNSSANSTEDDDDDDGFTKDVLDETEYLTPQNPYTVNDLSPSERADYEVLSKEDQKQYLKLQNHFKAIFEGSEMDGDLDSLVDKADLEIERDGGPEVSVFIKTPRAKGTEIGFWAQDDEDEMAQMEDADDEYNDTNITSMAELQLDLHKDIRHYTRMAAWDLPLLQQYAKPFQPPTFSTPLRFRYTTYMGEFHPAQNKVVVEFCSKDLLKNPNEEFALSEAQRIKLLKLVGVRYNPSTDVIKMACEKFGSAAQNKRHLGELIGKLIKEAKDKRDMFEDVALDTRHHRAKKQIVYPEHWKLRDSTVKRVLKARKEVKLLGGGEDAIPVDGRKTVEQYVKAANVKPANLVGQRVAV